MNVRSASFNLGRTSEHFETIVPLFDLPSFTSFILSPLSSLLPPPTLHLLHPLLLSNCQLDLRSFASSILLVLNPTSAPQAGTLAIFNLSQGRLCLPSISAKGLGQAAFILLFYWSIFVLKMWYRNWFRLFLSYLFFSLLVPSLIPNPSPVSPPPSSSWGCFGRSG